MLNMECGGAICEVVGGAGGEGEVDGVAQNINWEERWCC